MAICIPIQTQFITQAKYKVATYILYFHNNCDTTFTAAQKDGVVNNYVNPQFNGDISIKNAIMSLGTSICDNRSDQESKARSLACTISARYNLGCNCSSATAKAACSRCGSGGQSTTCPAGSTLQAGVFGFKECIQLQKNVASTFRLQIYADRGDQVQCKISFEAPQPGAGWSLDQAKVRLTDFFQSCKPPVGSKGQITVEAWLYSKASGIRTQIDYGYFQQRDDGTDASKHVDLNATSGGKRRKVSPGQVVVLLTYHLGSCLGPDHAEGNVVVDFGYVPYNNPPGAAPYAVRKSNPCQDPTAAGKCNWLVPMTWCDCTGVNLATLNVPGFGNLGCDSLFFMAAGLGLFAILVLLKR